MLKKIAIGLAVVVLVVVALALRQPDTIHVERSTTIAAPPETVYPLISDFRKWAAWSPWEELDPSMTRSYSGSESGQGAVYEWDGNKDVGAGRMQIAEARAPERVVIDLDFYRPVKSKNLTTFDIGANSNGTSVTWRMDAQANFLSKLVSVFVSMDNIIGTDFEKGLTKLKNEAEAAAGASS